MTNIRHVVTGDAVMNHERQHIAVGVILDQSGDHVLLSRRPDHVHLGGLWEFPGGKLHPGEQVLDALKRELLEELDINVNSATPLIQINHDYATSAVKLDVWQVPHWSGVPRGMEGQELKWVSRRRLMETELPAADRPIITAVNIPEVYGITRNLPVYDDNFFAKLESRLAAGLRMLQFRSSEASEENRFKALTAIWNLCHNYGCRLLMNGMPDVRTMRYVDGVHLPSKILLSLDSRPMEKDYLVGASCHNDDELEHAGRIGVDFVVLSPVKHTTSHTHVDPIGWDKFAILTEAATVPVYALGGMHYTDIWKAKSCGGQGVAMISGLWDE